MKDVVIGNTYNNWTVLNSTDNPKRWMCRCKCGVVKEISTKHLLMNKSTGCSKCFKPPKDITGKQYGFLTVVKLLGPDKNRHSVWECQCVCGNLKTFKKSDLVSGRVVSCGCISSELKRQSKITHGKSYTKEYRNCAVNKYRENKLLYDTQWTLEMEERLRFLFTSCVVCGITQEEHLEKYGISLNIDHVLPLSKGWGLVPGNATILCRTHNLQKLDRDNSYLPDDTYTKIIKSAELFHVVWNLEHVSNELY